MKNKGFTLIELLVVIGIIGMLVAIAIPNFLSARQRASDSRVKQEMSQLKNALRLYYNDFNKYPAGGGTWMFGCGENGVNDCLVNCSPSFASGATCDTVYIKRFPDTFLSSILYYQSGTPQGDDFCIRGVLYNKSDPDIKTSQSRCFSACSNGTLCSGTDRYCVCAD